MPGDVASKDDNNVSSLLGVSSTDGSTPVKVYASPTSHRLLVDGIGATGPTGPAGATGAAGGVALSAQAQTTGATGAIASIATTTVGVADAFYLVAGNVNVTSYSAGNFTIQVTYTDESNTVVTANMQGHFTSGYGTTISGAGDFEGQPLYIRAKAGTAITIKTAGTFTSLTYNASGAIMLVA